MFVGALVGGDRRHVDAVDADGARRRGLEPRQHPQQGALPAAGAAEQAEQLALVDVEVDVVDGDEVAELPGHAPDLDEGLGTGVEPRRRARHFMIGHGRAPRACASVSGRGCPVKSSRSPLRGAGQQPAGRVSRRRNPTSDPTAGIAPCRITLRQSGLPHSAGQCLELGSLPAAPISAGEGRMPASPSLPDSVTSPRRAISSLSGLHIRPYPGDDALDLPRQHRQRVHLGDRLRRRIGRRAARHLRIDQLAGGRRSRWRTRCSFESAAATSGRIM